MNKLFFDTNLWVRWLLHDNPYQFERVKSLLTQNESGAIQTYTSSIVLLEISYVLKSVYEFKFEEVLESLEGIRSIKNITILESTNIQLALEFFKSYKIKFSDCLIASQITAGMTLCTFDAELAKIKEITAKTPADLLP